MKKRIITLLTALVLTAGLIIGLAPAVSVQAADETTTEEQTTAETKSDEETTTAKEKSSSKKSAAEDETTTAEEEASDEEETTSARSKKSQETTDLTLEEIAKLNNCTEYELNTVFDDEGYLTFLGAKISETKIKDEEDALSCIESLGTLLGLDGINLKYYATDVSPNTDVTYYRFVQTVKGSLYGVDNIDVKYFNTMVRLGVGTDGYANMVSAYLNHDDLEVDTENGFITKDEAEEFVQENVPGVNIYPDYTVLTVWSDGSARSSSSSGTSALTWVVYADELKDDAEESTDGESTEEENAAEDATADAVNDDDNDCSNFIAYFVSAAKGADGEPRFEAALNATSLTAYSQEVDNTSISFFDDMEDAGEYTYTVNFDWMTDTDKLYSINYVGSDSMQVTVPVMYCKTDGLYYLGQKEHYVTMSNCADFFSSNGNTKEINCYVTDNPENLTSWHFKNASYSKTGQTFFDEPDYVISSFAKYFEVVTAFGNKFGIFEAYPSDSYMLCTYATSDYVTYPDDKSGFVNNAFNVGRMYDWVTFATSPQMGLCLDTTVMCHEFTHGVNSHFTDYQYANEQGAVMEGYADIIGCQMAAFLDGGDCRWKSGGTFGPELRDMSNPPVHSHAMYKKGIYYTNPANEIVQFNDYSDHGGVHQNSGVVNYLAYTLVEGETEGVNEKNLYLNESLYLWYELLYMSTYDTDFEDVGAYLIYAAEMFDLPEKKQAYMQRIITELGFDGEDVSEELLDAENSREFTINLNYEDEEIGETYYFCSILEAKEGMAICGGFENNETQTNRISDDYNYLLCLLSCTAADRTGYTGILNCDGVKEDAFTFNIKAEELDTGESLTFTKNETVKNLMDPDGITITTDEETGVSTITADGPAMGIIYTKKQGSDPGEYNAYLVSFTETAAGAEGLDEAA